MGRAGAGGGGGGRSFGGHSDSRISGGHRVGGGSRPGTGGGGWSMGGMPRPPRMSYPLRGPRRGSYYTFAYGGGYVRALLLFLVVIFILAFVLTSCQSDIPASTYERQKAETGVAFQNDCIVDELGWFDNIPQTERRLQGFYDETGVQPFIVLKAYDSRLTTDTQKEEYVQSWYEENIDNEGTFLYMYFAEADADSDVGYMCYVNGKQDTSVMDAEAVEIFWAYLDNAWYSDMSTDDMFVTIFDNTADRIMTKTTTASDLWKYVVICAIVIVAGVIIIRLVKLKHKRDKEEAEETERILNTPLEKSSDPLVEKYNQNEKG